MDSSMLNTLKVYHSMPNTAVCTQLKKLYNGCLHAECWTAQYPPGYTNHKSSQNRLDIMSINQQQKSKHSLLPLAAPSPATAARTCWQAHSQNRQCTGSLARPLAPAQGAAACLTHHTAAGRQEQEKQVSAGHTSRMTLLWERASACMLVISGGSIAAGLLLRTHLDDVAALLKPVGHGSRLAHIY
jgi:hypothetical protein